MCNVLYRTLSYYGGKPLDFVSKTEVNHYKLENCANAHDIELMRSLIFWWENYNKSQFP